MKYTLLAFSIFALFVSSVEAHQPRLVKGEDNIQIEDVEVSKAFYATLEGISDTYVLKSDTEFLLLAEVLTPVIAGKDPGEFSILLTNDETGEVLLGGTTGPFDEIFFEQFAGDEYRQGPSYEKRAPAGSYTITITGDEGEKYVLVTGKREFFPLDETLNTFVSLPSLKMGYFEKPFYEVFLNPIGGFMLVFLLLLALLLLGMWRLCLWLYSRARSQ